MEFDLAGSEINIIYGEEEPAEKDIRAVWSTFKQAGYAVYIETIQLHGTLSIKKLGNKTLSDVVSELNEKELLNKIPIQFLMLNPEINNPHMKISDITKSVEGLKEEHYLEADFLLRVRYSKLN
jgi:hypothetical protein